MLTDIILSIHAARIVQICCRVVSDQMHVRFFAIFGQDNARGSCKGLQINDTGASVDPLIRVSLIVDRKAESLPIPMAEFATTPWL